MSKQQSGFSILEIMIVVAIIALLSAIAIPRFIKSRAQSTQKACINNLRQIDGAIQQWALESRSLPSAVVTHTNVFPYLKNQPACPSAGGNFYTDYGMTFVKDAPFCVTNANAIDYPHSLSATN